ncbi:MAG: hypothetical protein JXR83_16115, partial [Deltaproteobacteria bacterium]|nr:hypothetical protein [Deltaproteobacteria bacterium]
MAASLAVGCDGQPTAPDAGPAYTEIVEGSGPCDQGFNLTIEGQPFFLPLAALPRTAVEVGGASREAIALAELLPGAVLDRYGFGGKFTTAELRLLYDCRLAGEDAGAPPVTVSPESMATGFLLVDDRSLYLPDAAAGAPEVADVCQVEALRRMIVTRAVGPGVSSAVVHVAELPTEPYLEQGTLTVAIDFADILAASGLLAGGELLTQFDYRLVAVDYLQRRGEAVLFPWSHGHLESLRWVPSALRTRSLDTSGDLRDDSGSLIRDGVASEGWSSVKHLLEVSLQPAPDPAH